MWADSKENKSFKVPKLFSGLEFTQEFSAWNLETGN